MCFIGHGAFGIITKQVWCNYFGVFGIEESAAYTLMPFVGIVDILMGIILIIYPLRIVAIWLIFWGLFTALLRPLSGESFAEFFERAGNYGAPLILLMLTGTGVFKNGFKKIETADELDEKQWAILTTWLRVFCCTLLLGHGLLNLFEKESLLLQYSSLGFPNPKHVSAMIGIFEIAAALMILIRPLPYLILILVIWKVGSEMFYPTYGFWEWFERGGSYGLLFGLWLVLKNKPLSAKTFSINLGNANSLLGVH
jgi:hypothetical protein